MERISSAEPLLEMCFSLKLVSKIKKQKQKKIYLLPWILFMADYILTLPMIYTASDILAGRFVTVPRSRTSRFMLSQKNLTAEATNSPCGRYRVT